MDARSSKAKIKKDFNAEKLEVHYKDGIKDAKRGFKPTWFDDEATEWKCRERDAYRAGYRTVIKDI